MAKRLDVPIGRQFGKLVIVEEVEPKRHPSGRTMRMVAARCNCGTMTTIGLFNVVQGKSRSCGCGKIESGKRSARHGLSLTPTWNSWISMIQRCRDKNCANYARYGASGITVCDKWMTFENFLSDMGERADGMSIDRIDGTKGYEPGNCRWATSKQQARNMKTNRLLEFRGENISLAEWAERLGLNSSTIRTRLRDGWTVDRALKTPSAIYRKRQAELEVTQ